MSPVCFWGYGGGFNERENIEYIEREESDGEYDEVSSRQAFLYLSASAKMWELPSLESCCNYFLLSQFGRKKKKFRGKSSSTPSSKESEKKEVKKEEEEEEEEDDEEDGDVSKYKLDVSRGVCPNTHLSPDKAPRRHHVDSFSRTMTTRTKMETCRSTSWTPATTTLTERPRKRAASRVRRAPPRAPPAPVLGPGPGKRAEVKGNPGQNVSISSTFFWFTDQRLWCVL